MKKNIASLLIFLFTVQIVTPSFAQGSHENDIANFTKCVNQLTENGKMLTLKVETGELIDKLDLTKGILAISLKSISSDIVEIISNPDTATTAALTITGVMTLLLAFLDVNKHKKGMVNMPLNIQNKIVVKVVTKTEGKITGTTVFPLNKKIEKITCKMNKIVEENNQWMNKRIQFANSVKWISVAAIAIFGTITYIRLQAHKAQKVNQNNQKISMASIMNTTTTLDFEQQLFSTSDSAKKILSKANKGCQKILAEVRSYQQDPELLYQELEAHKM